MLTSRCCIFRIYQKDQHYINKIDELLSPNSTVCVNEDSSFQFVDNI